ncbi:MAG TPA: glycosyltransferase family 39 protein [Blastocatellia bacterium]|nr:glycosyltransferase family 39 protein [Blastocatellia bacterium]
MQIVDELQTAYTRPHEANTHDLKPTERGALQRKVLVIIVTLALGWAARVYRLGAPSLAEDEVNKVFAIRSYQHGDFTVNAEHPFLMKAICLASLRAARLWNHAVANKPQLSISEEAALRLPNAMFGALTVVPLFLLADALFGFRVASLTAFFWALGLNSIWFNRVAKEDTLLVFFMMTGYYLYNRAKTLPVWDTWGQTRLYTLAGVAFGLMIASKYFPHYYGLLMLYYYLAGYDRASNRPIPRRTKACHAAALVLVFAAFNFPLFMPDTWPYLWKFVHADLLTHHGYIMMGRLYPNDMSHTPGGPPFYFYLLYLLVKTPLPLLIAFSAGLVEIFKRRARASHSSGYLFLRLMLIFWLFPMSLIATKFLRYTLALMPFVYMTAAIGAVLLSRTLRKAMHRMHAAAKRKSHFWRLPYPATRQKNHISIRASQVAGLLFFVAWPSITALANLPYPGLYTNALGGGRAGYFFPHDEFYDLGARESMAYIASHAHKNATVGTEIPGVLQYYMERFGRTDIRSEITSHRSSGVTISPPDFVLIQPGRIYYENRDAYASIEARFSAVQSSTYNHRAATVVYATGSQRATKPAPIAGTSGHRTPGGQAETAETPVHSATGSPDSASSEVKFRENLR